MLNGLGMLFMKLLTNRAQMFADVRTYWSGNAIKRVTGYEIEGHAKESDGVIHLINSGACCLDANGQARGADGERQPQSRGGMGLKNYNCTEKTGYVADVKVVREDDDLLIVADDGTIIRTAASGVSVLGRATQGVRIMRPNPGAKVISVARTEREDAE